MVIYGHGDTGSDLNRLRGDGREGGRGFAFEEKAELSGGDVRDGG